MELKVVTLTDLETVLRDVVRSELDARETSEILTRKQLSEKTGWSLSTIQRKMKKGLPHFGGDGEHPRFLWSQVKEWLTREESYL